MMITSQLAASRDIKERTRKVLTDYLSMFLPGSWQEPMARIKLLLHANIDLDWEALKGYALQIYDERRHSTDRVELLARVERLAETCKEFHATFPPTEWNKGIDEVILAANFRVSKIAVQSRDFLISDDERKDNDEE
ncbi:MAG: hypothetical protein ACFFED_06095 [Candidatus Thorarchaeota archaeon]